MWSLVVVERDPISNSTAGVREAFEALAVDALLFERALHHSVLLRTMRRDEFLLQTVAANERQGAPLNWPISLRETIPFYTAIDTESMLPSFLSHEQIFTGSIHRCRQAAVGRV